MRQAKFTQNYLHTAMVEMKLTINLRLLSYFSAENHWLHRTSLVGWRILNLHVPDDLGHLMSVAWANSSSKQHFEPFWKRWRNEYLVEFWEYHRQLKNKTSIESLPRAVVVVPGLHQGGWRLEVEEVLAGHDRQIRRAVVRLGTRVHWFTDQCNYSIPWRFKGLLKVLTNPWPHHIGLGLSKLCQHNFENNRSYSAMGIMPA